MLLGALKLLNITWEALSGLCGSKGVLSFFKNLFVGFDGLGRCIRNSEAIWISVPAILIADM